MRSFKQFFAEVSNEDLNKISSVLKKLDQNDFTKLPFNNIFGNKARIIIPFNSQEESDFVNALQDLGFKVDLKAGTASSKVKTQQGEKTREQRIGKLLQSLSSKDASWKEKLNWWEKNKDKLNNVNAGISIILSRHPIDILRMSDHDEIHSCHSPDRNFFKCAIQEAKTGGAIAYVVRSKDLEQYSDTSSTSVKVKDINNLLPQDYIKDLQSPDLFRDSSRGIKGIEPLERIRLRRFDSDKNSILVPELSTYGIKHIGFQDSVRSWLKNKQTVDMTDFDKYDLRGGEYQDNSASELWNDYFGTEYKGIKGTIDVNDEDIFEKNKQLIENYKRMIDGHRFKLFKFTTKITNSHQSGIKNIESIAEYKVPIINKRYFLSKPPSNIHEILHDSLSLSTGMDRPYSKNYIDSIQHYDLNDNHYNLYLKKTNSSNTPIGFETFLDTITSMEYDIRHFKKFVLKCLEEKEYIAMPTNPLDELKHFHSDQPLKRVYLKSDLIPLGSLIPTDSFIPTEVNHRTLDQVKKILFNKLPVYHIIDLAFIPDKMLVYAQIQIEARYLNVDSDKFMKGLKLIDDNWYTFKDRFIKIYNNLIKSQDPYHNLSKNILGKEKFPSEPIQQKFWKGIRNTEPLDPTPQEKEEKDDPNQLKFKF